MAQLSDLLDGVDDLPRNVPLLSRAQDIDVTGRTLQHVLPQLENEGRVIKPVSGCKRSAK